jgi:hypothetical protein
MLHSWDPLFVSIDSGDGRFLKGEEVWYVLLGRVSALTIGDVLGPGQRIPVGVMDEVQIKGIKSQHIV